MPTVNPSEVELRYSEANIVADFLAGDITVLRNVRLVRVLNKDGVKFPNPNYDGWFEDPKISGKGTPCAILVAESEKPYYESLKAPKYGFRPAGTWDLEMEDYVVDLRLTNTEARMFQNSQDGRIKVLRRAYDPLKYEHPIDGLKWLRFGIGDVVAPASGDAHLVHDQKLLHKEKVGAGLYSEMTWEEIDDMAWLRKASMPGGLGQVNREIEAHASLELERRGWKHTDAGWIPSEAGENPHLHLSDEEKAALGDLGTQEYLPHVKPPPPVGGGENAEHHQCVATTAAGTRCKVRGTVKVGDKHFCTIHSKAAQNELGVES